MSARFLQQVQSLVTRTTHDEAGQSTAEYALVILGAVAIATLLITWATGSHAISQLFDSVIDKVLPS
jgi:Flp pilus assembly pilin Flp